MMAALKLRIVSDLHMELSGKGQFKLPVMADECEQILVLAGDIGTWKQVTSWMIQFLRQRFKQVVLVTGNHEYYRQEWHAVNRAIKQRLSAYDNLHFLHNEAKQIGGVWFVGGTLWTDLNQADPETLPIVESEMNDYQQIHFYDGYVQRRLTAQDTLQMHTEFLVLLHKVMQTKQPMIVVTHHAPSFDTVCSDKPWGVDFAYGSDLSTWMQSDLIKLWVHGHTHQSTSYQLGCVPVITNARGYFNEKTGFKPECCVTISLRSDENV